MITREQLRERLRAGWPPGKSFKWEKWGGSPTAWLALLLSGISIYLTQIRQVDDLRVLMNGNPRPVFNDVLYGPSADLSPVQQTLIFINAGNRPVAIAAISLTVWLQSELNLTLFVPDPDEVCAPKNSRQVVIDYEFSPLVVEPGKMVPLRLEKFEIVRSTLGPVTVTYPKISVLEGHLRLPNVAVPAPNDIMAACLIVQVILPDDNHLADVQLGSARLARSVDANSKWLEAHIPGRAPVPYILFKRWR